MMLCHWVSGSWHFQGPLDPWRWLHRPPQNIRSHSPDDSFTSQKTWTLLLSSPLQLNCISNLKVVMVNTSWWRCSPGHCAVFTSPTFSLSSYHFKGFIHHLNEYLIIYFYSGTSHPSTNCCILEDLNSLKQGCEISQTRRYCKEQDQGLKVVLCKYLFMDRWCSSLV